MAVASIVIAASMFVVPTVLARTGAVPIPQLVSEQTQLRAELSAGSGRAAKLSLDQRQDLLKRQKKLLQMLEGSGVQTTADLPDAQRAFALSTLALIGVSLNPDDDERLVCKRKKVVGSHMVERVCRTVAQMRIDQADAAGMMDVPMPCPVGKTDTGC